MFVLAAVVAGWGWFFDPSRKAEAPQGGEVAQRASPGLEEGIVAVDPAERQEAGTKDRGEGTAEAPRRSLLESRFVGEPIVEQRGRFDAGTGEEVVVSLVRTTMKEPLVRVEDRYRKDTGGNLVLVSSYAMVAGHVIVEAETEAELRPLRERGYAVAPAHRFASGRYVVKAAREGLEAFEDLLGDTRAFDREGSPEADYIVFSSAVPNDPRFASGEMWGLRNNGNGGGVPGADIDAETGWDIRTTATPSMIVGIVDTGIRYTHEDLAANMWVNTDEVASNGIDDDANGVVDDVYGFNAVSGSGNPSDENGHGTHVAGTVGAVGNNGRGVTGVAWRVQLMALRFQGPDGRGTTLDAIDAIDYGRLNGARILNNSWGGGGFSRALESAIARTRDAGMVFVAAAGNDGSDNDTRPTYPTGYGVSNIVSVAASTSTDDRAAFSNIGRLSVDLAAPGQGILSTYFRSDSDYAYLSGTSMAAPHVAGALALVGSQFPAETASQWINRVLNGAEATAAFANRTTTGGRLNLARALQAAANNAPGSFRFALSTREVSEGSGTVSVNVERVGGASGTVSVTVSATNGSAVAGSDFVATPAILTWLPGESGPKSYTFTIVDNGTQESRETFTVGLSNPQGGASLGTPATVEVAILDDDTGEADTISLAASSFVVTEAVGAVELVFERKGSLAGEAGAKVYVVGFVQPGAPFQDFPVLSQDYDFPLSGVDFVMPAGERFARLAVPILNDAWVENPEFLQVTMDVFNADAGAIASGVIEIRDDDLSFDTWLVSLFGVDFGDPAVAGREADPDGDGRSNVREYAEGTNPLKADGVVVPWRVWLEPRLAGAEADRLTLEFQTNQLRHLNDLSLRYEGTTDLKTWTRAWPVKETVEDLAPITDAGSPILRERRRTTFAISGDTPQFFRVWYETKEAPSAYANGAR